tara:strand:- start:2430 stop:2618 length:189 start_codon:yes stop_codon:yes gene_type:complete
MKTITLMQFDPEIVVRVLVHNIKQFYSLTYNTGQTVTVIEFIDGRENHLKNSLVEVERLINS